MLGVVLFSKLSTKLGSFSNICLLFHYGERPLRGHCSCFTLKTLCHRLSCQAGLGGRDQDLLLAAAAAQLECDSFAVLDNANMASWGNCPLPKQFDDSQSLWLGTVKIQIPPWDYRNKCHGLGAVEK